ncbi:MAG: dTMP kinase [Ardenticatenia bacterium]|nr:MAG: dTMP kinase [Ardenticatenia bacterium]
MAVSRSVACAFTRDEPSMGWFISFEGLDGSGKTTQIAGLAQRLRAAGHDVLLTREPGGTAIGDQIRSILHDMRNAEMTALAEFLLYSASRAQLVRQVIRPHLERGGTVLCDRFADSSLAYQGYGRQLDLDWVREVTRFVTEGVVPHLTIYLDLPVEIGLARKQAAFAAQRGERNRLDTQPLEFYRRVRDGYLSMARAEPQRWLVIDATQSIDQVQQSIWERLQHLLLEMGEAAR